MIKTFDVCPDALGFDVDVVVDITNCLTAGKYVEATASVDPTCIDKVWMSIGESTSHLDARSRRRLDIKSALEKQLPHILWHICEEVNRILEDNWEEYYESPE